CHDQHRSSVYGQGGIKDTPDCHSCHPGYDIEGKAYLDCKACHMPYAVKYQGISNPYKADGRTHNLRIWVTTAPRDSMFYKDGNQSFVKLDAGGHAVGNTLDLVCLRCHQNWEISDVYEYAKDIHTEGLVLPPEPPPVITEYNLGQNYPNPFNQATTIRFDLAAETKVLLEVFDVRGHKVLTLVDQNLPSGPYQEVLPANGLASGIYFYRLETDDFVSTRKMVLLK
ncbi:T9SS type A sorting domain-containing protein, partial [bacterium]|nr:T9SS type A sorting domain-containing protein [bacterium]